ncbi:hypothetical protein [Pseudomonas tohonis]|uniref:hypothetical protein n=2 Tax=Pseudomonas TaxID=286 RepID=UPI001F39D23D|nr:hypothetical protein [Pseudomonas tohonis]
MSIEPIDLGLAPDGAQGDNAREAFDKVNRNLQVLEDGKQDKAQNLTALAELQGAVDRLPYFTGAGALSLAVLTQAARDFLAAPSAAQRQQALGLGSASLHAILDGGDDRTRGRVIRSGDAGIAGYFDMRGTIYETGTPADVAGYGFQVGFSQGSNIGVPYSYWQVSPYGALTVVAPLPGITANPAIGATHQRIYSSSDRTFVQYAVSPKAWSGWMETMHTGNYSRIASETAVTFKARQTFDASSAGRLDYFCAEFMTSAGTPNAGRVLFSQKSTYGLALAMSGSGSESASAAFQWVRCRDGVLQSTPLTFTYSGNVLAQGYVRLGADAPAIKQRKLTGTTPAKAGTAVVIAHGLPVAKILAVEVLIEYLPNQLIPALTAGAAPGMAGFQIEWYVLSSGIQLVATAGGSDEVLAKPVRILITYEE